MYGCALNALKQRVHGAAGDQGVCMYTSMIMDSPATFEVV